jgi:hypothetical protein
MWVREIPFSDSDSEFISRLKARCESTGEFELFPQGENKFVLHLNEKELHQNAATKPVVLGLPVIRIVQWPIIKVALSEQTATFHITPDGFTKWVHLVLITLFCFGFAAFLMVIPVLEHQDLSMPFFAGCIFLAGGIANLVQYYYWVRDGDGFHILDRSLADLLSELHEDRQIPAT